MGWSEQATEWEGHFVFDDLHFGNLNFVDLALAVAVVP